MEKSIDELKKIIHELDMQANIYSELLLTELNYREKLNRNQEVRNNFIETHLAIERKRNDKKKKKIRYGFFKYADEKSKVCLLLDFISYII